MSGADRPALSTGSIVSAVVTGCSPLVLWTVLNFLRPDLVGAMLDHEFGYVVTRAEVVLVIGGTLVFVLAGLQKKGARVGIWIGGVLLCTLPALFLVLFGPIIFTFMYGQV